MAATKVRARTSGTARPAYRKLFYSLFLPLAVALNLGLGLFILDELRPADWLGGVELTTGAFCCTIAGWLAASAWSRSYWAGAMERQIRTWRQMADAMFAWMEETPPSIDALSRLQGSLDEVLQQPASSALRER